MFEDVWIFIAVLAAAIGGLALLRAIFSPKKREAAYRNQLILLGGTLIAVLFVLVFLPLPEGKNEQLVTLAGILLSAAVALSSTTFLGNALAGMMLRAIRNFGAGDWIQVGDHFGRVTERELLHTEIQTEDSDLVTLPNLALVTQTVKVVRRSGTVISAEVSLGYDVAQSAVDEALLEAAREAGLSDPLVSVMALGDYSVVYRVAGLLGEVDRLLSHRSKLRRCMLDALHGAGIEIVSPTFMNTLARRPGQPAMPTDAGPQREAGASLEDVAFDKAQTAGQVEALRESLAELDERVRDADKRLTSLAGDERGVLELELARMKGERKHLERQLTVLEEQLDERAGDAPA